MFTVKSDVGQRTFGHMILCLLTEIHGVSQISDVTQLSSFSDAVICVLSSRALQDGSRIFCSQSAGPWKASMFYKHLYVKTYSWIIPLYKILYIITWFCETNPPSPPPYDQTKKN